MALVPCRECGKEVSDQAEACPFCGIKTPSKKKRQRNLIITVVLVSAAIGASAWGYHRISQAFAPPVVIGADGKPVTTATPAVPKLQPTVPVKPQIIQKDYKEKVGEMIDSGIGIWKIRNETGLSLKEINKIKREKKEKEKADKAGK